jgi:CHAT domain-containing protein
MTGTFDTLNVQPALGRAEAIRRAMLAYVNDASQPINAYPAIWGAFSIIGEGAAR